MIVRPSVAGFALLIAAVSGAAACGGSDDGSGPATTRRPAASTATVAPAVVTTAGSIDTPATATSRALPGSDVADTTVPAPPPRILVFTRTTGFRHDSIGAATEAIGALAAAHGFEIVATEDPATFTPDALAGFDAVVFLMTTGDVLDAAQQAAFEAYIEGGGGFAGVHAAADTEYDWPWYGELVGAWFQSHPAVQPATITVEDAAHASTAALPATWSATDEWYDFRRNVRGHAHVLLTVDESTYTGGSMGDDHPIAWCRIVGNGRSWYTALGHTAEQWATPELRAHVLGGLLTAAGSVAADCTA